MSLDWQAVGGASSAVASLAAVASIVLAYRGVRLSRDASALDRRNYLDGLFVRWLDSIDALDSAALPFLHHNPTEQELDEGAADLPDAYPELHLAFQRCRSATSLLSSTGLFDGKVEEHAPDDIATEHLIDVFHGALWAVYFSVIRYSPAEVASLRAGNGRAQSWIGALEQIEGILSEHEVPERYFPLFRASVSSVYPETAGVSAWQAADQILRFCKDQIANRYVELVRSQFPWNR